MLQIINTETFFQLTPEPAMSVTPEPAMNVTPEPAMSVTPEPAMSVTPIPFGKNQDEMIEASAERKNLINDNIKIAKMIEDINEKKEIAKTNQTESRKSLARIQLPTILQEIRDRVHENIYTFLYENIIEAVKRVAINNKAKKQSKLVNETKKKANEELKNYKRQAVEIGLRTLTERKFFLETETGKKGPFDAKGIVENVAIESKVDASTLNGMISSLMYIPETQYRLAKNKLIDYSINEVVDEVLKSSKVVSPRTKWLGLF